jgi:threonine dehydrogenase-like Zn-dependent dehydrogenase
MLSVYFDAVLWKIAVSQALMRVYGGAVWGPFSPLRMGEIPEPELPGSEWVKVRVFSCGLCGSDMHLMKLDFSPGASVTAIPGLERIFLGHELYCEVVEVGGAVTDLKVGDKVAFLGFYPSCRAFGLEPCESCAAGNYTLCLKPHMGKLPQNRGGGFSEYMVAHRSQWVKLPGSFTEDQAIMTEPFAVAVHAYFKRPLRAGERMLVIGSGTVGLNLLQVVKALQPGASVTMLARYKAQEEMALRLGADSVIRGGDPYRAVAEQTGGALFDGMLGSRMILGGFDVVHDTVGSGATFQDSLRWVRSKGTIILSGVQLAPAKVDISPIWHQEVNVTGINCHGQECEGGISRTSFEWAIELIEKGKVQTAPMISHHFPIRELRRAVETMGRKGREPTYKVVLEIA